MNEIIQSSVYKTQKGTPVTDSVKVAQVFGKMHKNIMKSIRNIMGSAQNLANEHWFAETTYTDAQGKRQPMFLMNRDGFSLLTMSLTGEKAMAFKVAFINAFNKMEETIKDLRQHQRRFLKRSHRLCALRLNRRKQSKRNKSNLKNKPQRWHSRPPSSIPHHRVGLMNLQRF